MSKLKYKLLAIKNDDKCNKCILDNIECETKNYLSHGELLKIKKSLGFMQ